MNRWVICKVRPGRKQPIVDVLKNYATPRLSSESFDGGTEFSKHLRDRTEPKGASTVLIGVSCEMKCEEMTIMWVNKHVMESVRKVNQSNPSVLRNGISNDLRSVHTKFVYHKKLV